MQFLIAVLAVVVVILALVVTALSKSITDLRERVNGHGEFNSSNWAAIGELQRSLSVWKSEAEDQLSMVERALDKRMSYIEESMPVLERRLAELRCRMPKPSPELSEAGSPGPDANTMRHIHNARDTAIDHCNRATTYRVPGESALGVSVPLRDVVERILDHLGMRVALVREHIKLEPSCEAGCQIEVRDGLLYASDDGIKPA